MNRWTRRELANGAALCLELGVGLLENGAETSRVEETIRMAGQALGMNVEAMVHPTGITVGFGHGEMITLVARVKHRVIDLNRVAEMNKISRELHDRDVDLDKFRQRIRDIQQAPDLYTERQKLLAIAITCASLTPVVGGNFEETMAAVVAGVLSAVVLTFFEGGFPTFLSLFTIAFLSTSFGVAGSSFFDLSVEAIVVGSLLPQMPGLAFVSAMRDLMAGELVAGNARLAEALLITLGMASGVLACLGFAVRLGITS